MGKNLSDRLQLALQKIGMRPVELAKIAGCSPQAINNILKRDTRNSQFTAELARALNVRYEWLATGEGEMHLSSDPLFAFQIQNKIVPILSLNQLVTVVNTQNIEFTSEQKWMGARKEWFVNFGYEILDNSMFPELKAGDIAFIKEENDKSTLVNNALVLILETRSKTIMHRKTKIVKKNIFYEPQNTDIFKEISDNNSIVLLGKIVAIIRNTEYET
jgi:hypothetical protein